jgi:hypothetical protein
MTRKLTILSHEAVCYQASGDYFVDVDDLREHVKELGERISRDIYNDPEGRYKVHDFIEKYFGGVIDER